ncbi:MAG TPA: Tim44-like domain-containing protein [Burkholderiaceae bacterium]
MKRIALIVTLFALAATGLPADAKRLGGGGMKRSLPTQPAPTPAKPATPQQAQPAQQAAPTPTAAPTAPKRSWMGPLAGLAAGLGLAALASHFGFGAGLANVMTIVLVGLLAFMVIGFLIRRFAPKPAHPAAYGGGGYAPVEVLRPAQGAAPLTTADTEFASLAKQVFIRLQAANDRGDQADLRRFTTPQMYASIQSELLERKGGAQQTEVLQLNASVIDRAEENGEQVVSVRFSGMIREEAAAGAENFDEIWHLVRPLDGSREWAIAGIQAAQ